MVLFKTTNGVIKAKVITWSECKALDVVYIGAKECLNDRYMYDIYEDTFKQLYAVKGAIA